MRDATPVQLGAGRAGVDTGRWRADFRTLPGKAAPRFQAG